MGPRPQRGTPRPAGSTTARSMPSPCCPVAASPRPAKIRRSQSGADAGPSRHGSSRATRGSVTSLAPVKPRRLASGLVRRHGAALVGPRHRPARAHTRRRHESPPRRLPRPIARHPVGRLRRGDHPRHRPPPAEPRAASRSQRRSRRSSHGTRRRDRRRPADGRGSHAVADPPDRGRDRGRRHTRSPPSRYRRTAPLIAVAGLKGGIAVIERASRRIIQRLTGPGLPVWSMAFAGDSRTLLTGGADRVDPALGRGRRQADVKHDSRADRRPRRIRPSAAPLVFRACRACHTLTPDEDMRAGPTLPAYSGAASRPRPAMCSPMR